MSLKKNKLILQKLFIDNNIKGTLIISNEGLNATISGKSKNISLISKKIKSLFGIINFDSEVLDTASAYDTSNKRFTVPSGQAGKYYIFGNSTLGSSSNTTVISAFFSIYKNGSLYKPGYADNRVNYTRYVHISIASVMELAVGDYVEMFGKVDVDSGTVEIRIDSGENTFGGYKIIE